MKPRTKSAFRKITLLVPTQLLEEALRIGGQNLTQTVRQGLQLIAAKEAYRGIMSMRGKVKFSIDLEDMRYDG